MGRASASDSRFATSFFEARLRFLTRELVFSILETKAECLIVRLSFLFVAKPSLSWDFMGLTPDREIAARSSLPGACYLSVGLYLIMINILPWLYYDVGG